MYWHSLWGWGESFINYLHLNLAHTENNPSERFTSILLGDAQNSSAQGEGKGSAAKSGAGESTVKELFNLRKNVSCTIEAHTFMLNNPPEDRLPRAKQNTVGAIKPCVIGRVMCRLYYAFVCLFACFFWWINKCPGHRKFLNSSKSVNIL